MAPVDEGIRVRVTGLRVQGLPVYYLSFSVVVGVKDHPPLGDLGRALRRRPTLVLRGHPGAPPVNDAELIQRGKGLFTERRWRKQSTAETFGCGVLWKGSEICR